MFANLPIYPTTPFSSFLPIPPGAQPRFPIPAIPFAGTPQLVPTQNPYVPFTSAFPPNPFANPYATPYPTGINPYLSNMPVPTSPIPQFMPPQFMPTQFVPPQFMPTQGWPTQGWPTQGWTPPNTPVTPV